MYKRMSMILLPITSILFAFAAIWGYGQFQEKNQIQIKAENQYQRAFHDLSFHMERLHEELGNTLAVSSTSNFHRKGFVNLWRLTSEAQAELNQLPLSLMPFQETEQLLANITRFSYQVSLRDLHKQPFTASEMKLLKTLHERSKEIKNDLRQVQEAVINDHLKWVDAETILSSGKPATNGIVDGLRSMNQRVIDYGEMDWGPSTMNMSRRLTMQALSGSLVSSDEVKQKAAKLLNKREFDKLEVVENGAGTDLQTYTVTASEANGDVLQLEYTKKGGHLVYFLASRDIAKTKVPLEQATRIAEQFLQKHGYGKMRAVSVDTYNHVASITFAKLLRGITIYRDKLSINIALDNAEVVGLSARDMLYSRDKLSLTSPRMTQAEVRKMLHPDFRVSEVTKALILDDFQQEVLCYEFLGSIHGDNYRIFLNSNNGFEEKIEHLRDEDINI
jgi:spore germination protein